MLKKKKKVFIKTTLTDRSRGFCVSLMAPRSDAAFGLPLVTAAVYGGIERARGEVAGPSLFGASVFWIPVEQTHEASTWGHLGEE